MTAAGIIQLMATGALAGLTAGFIGVGGGVVLTPLCLLIYPAVGAGGDDLIKIIFGTNMSLIMAFSIAAVLAHSEEKAVDWRTVFIMGPLAIAGSFMGGALATVADPGILRRAYAVFLLFASALLVVQGSTKPSGAHGERRGILPTGLLPLLGLIAGVLGAFLGIGGGIVMIPGLILLFGMPVSRVAATSSSVIVFIGLAGMISYMWYGRGIAGLPAWSTGYVWWAAALPIMLAGIPAARLGAKLNARASSLLIRRISGALLFGVGIKLLFF